jgi:vancomycin aglycone glucosyltransferase
VHARGGVWQTSDEKPTPTQLALSNRRVSRDDARTIVRILFAPYGTRGDIQPLIALAVALQARSHSVRFLVPSNSVQWVRARGFACESNGVDVEAEVRSIESDTSAMRRYVRRMGDEIVPLLFDAVSRAAVDADLLVSSGVSLVEQSVAEARGILHVFALFCPAALPNSDGPPPVFQRQRFPRWVNAALWPVMFRLGDFSLGPAINRGRATLGLPVVRRPMTRVMTTRILVAADPDLAPLAAGAPPNAVQTDPWILRDPGGLDPRVEAFVRAGPPPIYVGFGSMVAKRSLRLGQRIVQAAASIGCRLIVAGGWASLDAGLADSERVLAISDAPHDKLFPHVAAAVHHGGAGTTTAAAQAGIPQIVVPHVLDQFYWARRVELLGLGPRSLPLNQVSDDALATRMAAVLNDSTFRDRARDLGLRASRRDGVPAAVEYLEHLL